MTLNLLVVLSNGFEYTEDYDLRHGEKVSTYYHLAGENAVRKSGVTTKRSNPEPVGATVYRLTIKDMEIKKEKVKTLSIMPPVAQLTETEFEYELANMLDSIPAEFHPFIRKTSWDAGHSAGYGEVLNYAGEYIYDLKPCIENFKKTVQNFGPRA